MWRLPCTFIQKMFDELVFGLALTALEGAGRRGAAHGQRPKLTVVASKEG